MGSSTISRFRMHDLDGLGRSGLMDAGGAGSLSGLRFTAAVPHQYVRYRRGTAAAPQAPQLAPPSRRPRGTTHPLVGVRSASGSGWSGRERVVLRQRRDDADRLEIDLPRLPPGRNRARELRPRNRREAARQREVLLARHREARVLGFRDPDGRLQVPPAGRRGLRELRPAREDRGLRRLHLHRRLRRRARRRQARRGALLLLGAFPGDRAPRRLPGLCRHPRALQETRGTSRPSLAAASTASSTVSSTASSRSSRSSTIGSTRSRTRSSSGPTIASSRRSSG